MLASSLSAPIPFRRVPCRTMNLTWLAPDSCWQDFSGILSLLAGFRFRSRSWKERKIVDCGGPRFEPPTAWFISNAAGIDAFLQQKGIVVIKSQAGYSLFGTTGHRELTKEHSLRCAVIFTVSQRKLTSNASEFCPQLSLPSNNFLIELREHF